MRVPNLGRREAATVEGTTPVRVLAGAGGNTRYRQGLQIANCDPGRTIFARMSVAGADAPTFGATDFDYAIGPRATLVLQIDEKVDVWILNDSGSVATSAYVALEAMA